MILSLILGLAAATFYFWPNPKPILGVYNQPGKWFYLKALFIYGSIQLRKWQEKRKGKKESKVASVDTSSSSNSTAGYGVKGKADIAAMEKAQPLADHKLAIDAVLLSCGGRDGSYMVLAMARRKLGMTNTIFTVRIPGVGVLLHPNHPDTTTFTDVTDTWEAAGVKMDLVEPMKKWKCSYEGPMIHQETGKTHQVNLKGVYTSDLPYFDFDADMDPWAMATALAKEPWSREYFDRLRAAHQSHYEQFGELTGSVVVDGGSAHALNLNVMRDHTHGSTRDWRLMRRYGIQNFTTETGFRGFIGVICQPVTFTSMDLGYVYTPQGECLPVQEIDLPLWAHGESGEDPKDFAFRFRAGDIWHEIEVKVLDTVEVFMGWRWEARILERFCEYRVDGVRGWGVSEWHYNHMEAGNGRPKEREDKDPAHTRGVEKY